MKRVMDVLISFENLKGNIENLIDHTTNEETKMDAIDLLEEVYAEIEYFEESDYQNELRIFNELNEKFNNLIKAA